MLKNLMKKNVLILITFLLGAVSAFGQAFVRFEKQPQLKLSTQSEYHNYRIKYKSVEKSTIYLELKKGNLIVASGSINVPEASEKALVMSIKAKSVEALTQGQNYSYNLYMYSGGRNDWTKKSCKSVNIPGVSMQKKENIKQKNAMSFRNFFN